MKRLLLLFFSILILPIEIIAENIGDSPYYVSGKIIDKEDGSPVVGAIIETFTLMGVKANEKTTSNSKGEFNLLLFGSRIICIRHPKYKTVYRYIGYPRYQKYINLAVVKKSEWEERSQIMILPLIIAKLLITEEEISPIVKRATGVEEVLKGEKKMWIARDKDGELTLFSNKPHRCTDEGGNESWDDVYQWTNLPIQ